MLTSFFATALGLVGQLSGLNWLGAAGFFVLAMVVNRGLGGAGGGHVTTQIALLVTYALGLFVCLS